VNLANIEENNSISEKRYMKSWTCGKFDMASKQKLTDIIKNHDESNRGPGFRFNLEEIAGAVGDYRTCQKASIGDGEAIPTLSGNTVIIGKITIEVVAYDGNGNTAIDDITVWKFL